MDSTLMNAATENFNLPHDGVILPTGGIFYKSKKKSIKVGYLTATDENYLMSGLGSKDNIVMTLLRNKIYEHDLRPDELLDEDIQAILLFLRNTAFGPEYTVISEDPKTNKKFESNINLGEFKRARAISTRCCSPPLISKGILNPLLLRPTLSNTSFIFSSIKRSSCQPVAWSTKRKFSCTLRSVNN